MKKTLFLLLSVLILSSCDSNSSPEVKMKKVVETTENFDWLVGKWKRNNNEPNRTTYEVWHKISRDEYKGWGYTMQYHDTISMESLSLTKTNNEWKVAVITMQDSVPTYFKLTEFDKNSFVCENNEIDFPNKIHYWRENRVLLAKISNSKHEIDFSFNRVKGKVTNINSPHKHN